MLALSQSSIWRLVLIAGLAGTAGTAQAVIISPNPATLDTNGNAFPFNGTIPNENLILDGTGMRYYADAGVAQYPGQQSAFNTNVFNDSAGSLPAGTFGRTFALEFVPIVQMPISGGDTNLGGYFEFLYDAREVGQERNTTQTHTDYGVSRSYDAVDAVIDDIKMTATFFAGTVNETVITFFDLDTVGCETPASCNRTDGGEPIVVVNNAQSDNALLGSRPDLGIYVPIAAFVRTAAANPTLFPDGLLNSSFTLDFQWTQSNASNGPDEWIVRDCTNFIGASNPDGLNGGAEVSCFGSDIPVYELPIPGALSMMLSALAGLGFLAWRRRTA
jgi:hypothetical protein